MLQYCSLYSGSTGNSFLVKTENTNILIDVGVSLKKLNDALNTFNIDIKSINAILITHEHIDHTKSLSTLSQKYNIPIYITQKTWNAISSKEKINLNNIIFFNIDKEFYVKNLKIFPFKTNHDAADPCGFNIYNNNKKISIATDLGHIDNSLLNHLKNSSAILLESNYDPDILKCSNYPYILKRRIAGNSGHLSNIEAGKTLSYLSNYGLNNALLIHLSKENNFPDLAYQTVLQEIPKNKNIDLNIAPRSNPSNLFNVI